jgi:glutathione S-transferase
MDELVLQGRSSSHFTRVARIFALDLGVSHVFRPVLDIASRDMANYAGNPALKVPILIDESGPLYGTENICRELLRRSGKANVIMPGDPSGRLVANVEEVTLHLMSAEVSVITAKLAGSDAAVPPKVVAGIQNSLCFLDEHVDALLSALPERRALSFVEVALFCVVTHLPWRLVAEVESWKRLGAFCQRFAERESARSTEYRFDAA